MTAPRPSYLDFVPPPNAQTPRPRLTLAPGEAPSSDYDDRLPEEHPLSEPSPDTETEPLPIVTSAQLLDTYPSLRPPLIEGLLRVGETMNLIAAPKVGKSFLSLDLALAVALGIPWLDRFATTKGKVLVIDNELHPETIASRWRRLCHARSVDPRAVSVSFLSLRGRLQEISVLGPNLLRIGRGVYDLVLIDAMYRVTPAGTDENDNRAMTNLYNRLDLYADALNAGFGLIHHGSKGNQSDKAVTDVGAGAGAQSRATDTHLILRPHEEDKVAVLEAAVRSWPPVTACCLRWEHPLWTSATDLDPTKLRQAKRRRRSEDGKAARPPKESWNAKRFAEAVGKPEPKTRAALLDDASYLPDLSATKAKQLLAAAIDKEFLYVWPQGGAATADLIATVPPPSRRASKSGTGAIRKGQGRKVTR
jgi:hypothetical protein